MLRLTFKPFSAREARIRQHGDGAYYIKSKFDLGRLSLRMLQEIWENFQPQAAKAGDIEVKLTPEDAVERVATLLSKYLEPLSSKELDIMAKEAKEKADKAAAKEAKKAAAKAAAAETETETEGGVTAEQAAARKGEIEQELADAKAKYTEFVAERKAELKTLAKGPRAPREPSERIQKVLELLRREEGATKSQIAEGTGAAKGYVAALISRILPEKGFTLTAEAQENSREKVYRISE